jgi:hypothetical protein
LRSDAKSPDGKTVYAMFQSPLWDAATKTQEMHKGKPFTRILELDVAGKTYGTRQWKYAIEEAGNVAADFQMLTATTGLVIERDDATEGAGTICRDAPRTDCFTRPARFKRIYKIDMAQMDADGFVKKVAFIDLTKIANPKRLARKGPNEENFVLPHLDPEGLTVVDTNHGVVVNDNNSRSCRAAPWASRTTTSARCWTSGHWWRRGRVQAQALGGGPGARPPYQRVIAAIQI